VSRFTVRSLPIEGLRVLQRQKISDHRGFLSRIFCAEELQAAGWSQPIAQINHSCTLQRGTIRGLHFQHPPFAELKLVSCVRGSVFDVAVDLRMGSPTYLHWHAEVLSADNQTAMLIPAGFAHGFQTLEDSCELLYCHSNTYHPQSEGGLNAMDSALAIAWPIGAAQRSERDTHLPSVAPPFQGILP
jgi:dTDP-4-dehydrorhamnose 3,5-epimerase